MVPRIILLFMHHTWRLYFKDATQKQTVFSWKTGISKMTNGSKVILIIVIAFVVTGLTFTFPPMAQDPTYHDFADKRGLSGIPNFGDVMGNLLFMIFSLMGMRSVFRSRIDLNAFTMKGECTLWEVFFVGTFLVGFGSGYYHLEPSNHTLVWDRLPMTIAFMSFFSLIVMERISEKGGLFLFPLLLIAGAGSVFYWDYTESLGNGDLRPYALVQFLPVLLLPLIFWLLPARYSGLKYLGYVLLWYVLAKVLEHFDPDIFGMTAEVVSGHTLKHIAAAISVYMMVVYVKKRRLIL
jgi:hypothetical protein